MRWSIWLAVVLGVGAVSACASPEADFAVDETLASSRGLPAGEDAVPEELTQALLAIARLESDVLWGPDAGLVRSLPDVMRLAGIAVPDGGFATPAAALDWLMGSPPRYRDLLRDAEATVLARRRAFLSGATGYRLAARSARYLVHSVAAHSLVTRGTGRSIAAVVAALPVGVQPRANALASLRMWAIEELDRLIWDDRQPVGFPDIAAEKLGGAESAGPLIHFVAKAVTEVGRVSTGIRVSVRDAFGEHDAGNAALQQFQLLRPWFERDPGKLAGMRDGLSSPDSARDGEVRRLQDMLRVHAAAAPAAIRILLTLAQGAESVRLHREWFPGRRKGSRRG